MKHRRTIVILSVITVAASVLILFGVFRQATTQPCNRSSSLAALDIAFVKSTFTLSAYSHPGFYDFYYRYGYTGPDVRVKNGFVSTDLNYLKVPVVLNPGESSDENSFIENARLIAGENSRTQILTDVNVHNGGLSRADGCNNYDIIILSGHFEYATQQEYDNLQKFVAQGGLIVFLDGNNLYAEVKYDQGSQTITLVQGHGWNFDGLKATKGPIERWFNQNELWMGGASACTSTRTRICVTYSNLPFEYKQYEEQYITNPNAHVIYDFGANFVNPNLQGKQVATYTLDYGKGRVLVMGLYTSRILVNDDFQRFFDPIFEENAVSWVKQHLQAGQT